jgi:hypothetical protein
VVCGNVCESKSDDRVGVAPRKAAIKMIILGSTNRARDVINHHHLSSIINRTGLGVGVVEWKGSPG